MNFIFRLLAILTGRKILLIPAIALFMSYINLESFKTEKVRDIGKAGFDLFSYYYYARRGLYGEGIQVNVIGYMVLLVPFVLILFYVSVFLQDYLLQGIQFTLNRCINRWRWYAIHFLIVSFATIVFLIGYNMSLYTISSLFTSFEPMSVYSQEYLHFQITSLNAWFFVLRFSIMQGVIFLPIIALQGVLTVTFGSLSGLLTASGISGGVLLSVIVVRQSFPIINELILDNPTLQYVGIEPFKVGILLVGAFIVYFMFYILNKKKDIAFVG